MKWGRLYAGTRNHRKIRILREQFPDCWTAWYVLIELAIECDDQGWIYIAPDEPFSTKQLAKEIGIKRKDVAERFLNYLESPLKLIQKSDKGILLLGFAERNLKSDCSTPRVRKYREKRKERQTEETPENRFCNVSETDQNRYRTDTDIYPPLTSPPAGGSPSESSLDFESVPDGQDQGQGTFSEKTRGKKIWSVPYDAVVAAWNECAPPKLPRVRALDDKRRRLIKAAWAENPSLDWFRGFFSDLSLSAHHRGDNDKGWTPDIAWVLSNRLRLSEVIDNLKTQALASPEVRHAFRPDCPRCGGYGLVEIGTTDIGTPIMTTCNCQISADAKIRASGETQ